MSEGRTTGIGRARVALGTLQRAMALFYRFPPDHVDCTRAIDEAQAHLRRHFQDLPNEPLHVEVQEEGLFVNEQSVQRAAADSATDLHAILRSQGIVRLTFSSEVNWNELRDLVVICAARHVEWTDGDSRSSDVLMALWVREFKHIRYQLLDPFDLEQEGDPEARFLAERVDDLWRRWEGKSHDEDLVMLEDLEQRAGDLAARPTWSTIPELGPDFRNSQEGEPRRRLLREVQGITPDDELERARRIVDWSLASDAPPVEEDAARFLATAVLRAICAGELQRAATVLARMDPRSSTRPAVFLALGGKSSMGVLAWALEYLWAAGCDRDELVRQGMAYMSLLDNQAVASVVDLYAGITEPDVRRVIRRFLSTRVEEQADAIATLTHHPGSQVVKEALGILALGHESSRARELLTEAAKGTGVRGQLARTALEVVTGERERKKLHKLLRTEPDKARRMRALKRLRRKGDLNSFERLRELVHSPRFGSRDDDELVEVLEVLVHLGGDKAPAALADLINYKVSDRTITKIMRRVKELAEAKLEELRSG
jgi:hypothetical protein